MTIKSLWGNWFKYYIFWIYLWSVVQGKTDNFYYSEIWSNDSAPLLWNWIKKHVKINDFADCDNFFLKQYCITTFWKVKFSSNLKVGFLTANVYFWIPKYVKIVGTKWVSTCINHSFYFYKFEISRLGCRETHEKTTIYKKCS